MLKQIIKKLIEKKNLFKIILSLLFLILIIITFTINNNINNYLDILKPRCIISSISEFEECKNKNSYVTVHTNKIYSTNYVYNENNNTSAIFIDIDLEGKSLIAVIENEIGKDLLSKEGPFTIEGRLEYDENTKLSTGRNNVIEDYKSQVEDQVIKDKIENNFLEGTLNQYTGGYENVYIILGVYSLLTIVLIYSLIKNSYILLKIKY